MKTKPSKSAQTNLNNNQPIPQTWKKKSGMSWQLWGLVLVIISGSIGYFATTVLLKLSPIPNCAKIYMPMTSASDHLYCAQIEAEKGGVENLLTAITMMDKIGSDHPLNKTIQEYREEWADQIFALGEKDFQDGKIEDAIAIAQKIPFNSQAYQLVETRIQTWREIWEKGEKLMEEAEFYLRDSQWNQAFGNAVNLTNLKNRYWATTKYEELVGKIQLAREESAKLDKAYTAIRNGDADSLLKAIDIANQISKKSYAYKEANDIKENAQNKLLQKMQYFVDNRLWNTLGRIANKIPAHLNLQEQVIDWNNLANAGMKAEIGTFVSLESAIVEAQKINVGNFLYDDAQALINKWQEETQAVAHLTQARQFAQIRSKNNYQIAITEASLISSNNPRYDEAQREINSWNREIELLEDEPILEMAKQWARGSTVDSLQRAIAQARLIGNNRPLYSEAQDLISQWQKDIEIKQDRPILNQAIAHANTQDYNQAIQIAQRIGATRNLYSEAQSKIATWRNEIEIQEDRPILNQAIAHANTQDYNQAIQMAQRISNGRNLYSEAQKNISIWRQQQQANETLSTAMAISQSGNYQDLVRAIGLTSNIPSNTIASSQANQMRNRWSYQVLAIAQAQANISIQDAVDIASLIPSYTPAYSSAQAQIQGWENLMKPPIVIP